MCRRVGSLFRARSERRISLEEVDGEDPSPRSEPGIGKDYATVEEGSRSTELRVTCEDSYRMWEMNKQMSPLQPLLD